MRNLLRTCILLPRKVVVQLIVFYQSTLSPDHGPLKALHPYGFCRHAPTCSQFTKEAIARKGVIIGGLLGFLRLLSCHPWKRPSARRIMETSHRHRSSPFD
ncbi:TPA: hypothetical protein DCL30_02445 [Candidatus Peribacteria bacterium]|nr:MAG: hypothetical protein A3J91_04325 [Candidatus Peribacteria bacterium RIFOXYC2_FULL_58_10]OGJ85111.1 MAG: hypothetical protein A2529_01420 [Candidatus Peribacteria bacterium RIFOXYD2_FULL_58_15]HAI98382.1 hypothetical protein [Candidatus Peribacteria bacterium]HAS33803.1 hypothetical protein [Candidatus Peribacteria bacterium]